MVIEVIDTLVAIPAVHRQSVDSAITQPTVLGVFLAVSVASRVRSAIDTRICRIDRHRHISKVRRTGSQSSKNKGKWNRSRHRKHGGAEQQKFKD
jgi:hypothetical protein